MAGKDYYIIGIDHGNGYTKTVNTVFRSRVDTYMVEPPMKEGLAQRKIMRKL